MAEEHIDALKRARENFVRKRREMAEQMVPAGAAAAHFAPMFSDLQAVIEAIDRAIKDEEGLPEDYALEEADESFAAESPAEAAEGSNVVDVDFDKS